MDSIEVYKGIVDENPVMFELQVTTIDGQQILEVDLADRKIKVVSYDPDTKTIVLKNKKVIVQAEAVDNKPDFCKCYFAEDHNL